MKVIATATGYDGIVVREPGEVFEIKDGKKGSWFKPAEELEASVPRGKGKKPPVEDATDDLE
jgi:hypothetical protein